jgi:hypothetical protein
MIIPNKFNGFHNGVRRCFGGAGGGGGGGDGGGGGAPGGDAGGGGGPNNVYTPNYNNTNTGNTTFNSNRGNVTGMNFNNTGGYNSSGVNNMQGVNPATTRPYAGSDQFFQPVYNSQYQNYARPTSQFDTSMYGTQPMNSPAFNSGMSRGAINQNLNNFYNTNYRDNPQGASMGSTLDFMRQNGINRSDFQTFGGVNNYGPQMSMPQMQSPFNPYSNSSGQSGVLTPYSGGRPTDVMGGDYMGGRRGPAIPFAQNMGQLGMPAGLDDTMTPDIMAANAATQQQNAASRANSAANPASISDLSKRLGLMGGFAVSPQQGQMQPQGMLTNRLDQPQGQRLIPQEMIEANKKAAALTALEAPTNYSAENMRDMMKSRQGGVPDYATGGDYTGGKGFGGPMGGDMSVGATAPSGMGESSVGSVGYAAPTTGGGTTTYGGMGGPMGMMPQQGSFLPQMQNPFSYQPSYGGYNSYGGDFGGGLGMYTPVTQHPLLGNGPQPAAQPQTRLAGSGISRRPVRRAEGGIASLMDDVA